MKKAFTLAEVLITLAILGFVASVTLPALMTNVQLQELQTQFKRTFLDLNEFASYFQIEHNESVPKYIVNRNNEGKNGSELMRKEFVKYTANAAKVGTWTDASGRNGAEMEYKYKTLTETLGSDASSSICDNSGFYIDGLGRIISFDDAPKAGYNGPRICVDINGVKKPNTYGIDVFTFLFTTDGMVIPEGKLHVSSNITPEAYNKETSQGWAWEAGTITGPENCYNSRFGQTCAYYAQKNENPKNPNEEYWKHFIGQKQYLNKEE